MKIWSLLPSATEILFALGLDDGMLAHIFHPDLFRETPPIGNVMRLVSPAAGGSSVENWAPPFEPLIGVAT